MNYKDIVKEKLNYELGMGESYDSLLDLYTLLVFTVGVNCTNENVHDAWSLWESDPNHRSLIPFNELTEEVQELDSLYRKAIIKVANTL